MQLITVKFDNGESVTMNEIEVMWFGRDGGIVGHCALEEFREFCQDVLDTARLDAKREDEI